MTQPPGAPAEGPGNPWATPPRGYQPPAPPPVPVPVVPPRQEEPAPVWLPPYEPPRRRRPLVMVIVVAVLLLAGGAVGGFLVLHRPKDGTGRASATDAAQAFLTAVYQTRDVDAVAPLVCAAARDRRKIQAKINEIAGQDKRYRNPRYTWTPPVTGSTTRDRAVVSTTVTLTTDDEQTASQKLNLTVIHSTGWFVCDVQSTPAA